MNDECKMMNEGGRYARLTLANRASPFSQMHDFGVPCFRRRS